MNLNMNPMASLETNTETIMRKGRKKMIEELEAIKSWAIGELKEKNTRNELIHFESIDFNNLNQEGLALLEKSLNVDNLSASELRDFYSEIKKFSDSLKAYKEKVRAEKGHLPIDDSRVNAEMHLINKAGNAMLDRLANNEWPYSDEELEEEDDFVKEHA